MQKPNKLHVTRKAQLLFLALLILFLPSNLGLHFEMDFSYVLGYKVPYFVPTLYLTDIFLLGLFSTWLLELFLDDQARMTLWLRLKEDQVAITLFLFLILALPNLSVVNKAASLWLWVLLLKGSFLFIYVKETLFGITQKKILRLAFGLMILFQSIFAITQFFTQKPLFAYPYFGETAIDSAQRGIAQINLGGERLIRAYGTAPHPNVLGGILVVALLVLILNKHGAHQKQDDQGVIPAKAGIQANSWIPCFVDRKVVDDCLWWMTVSLGLVSLVLTFSRSAWLALFLALVWIFHSRVRRLKDLALILIVGVTLLWMVTTFGSFETPSFRERVELSKISLVVVKQDPFFGVGLGNFLIRLQEEGGLWGDYRFLQPVHNIYLLLVAEVGLLGFLVFGFFLYQIVVLAWKRRRDETSSLPLLVAVLTLGLFDHYLLTLQQGILLFFLCLGLVSGVNLVHERKT